MGETNFAKAPLKTGIVIMDLKNKVVVVTGGSDGIGRHICLKLGMAGAQVALLGRNADRLASVKSETLAAGAPKAAGIVCDLQDIVQINAAVEMIKADFGGIDILVNNAGIWHKAGPLDTISPEMLETTVQTNLTGLMQMTQAALPAVRDARCRSVPKWDQYTDVCQSG